MGHPRHAPFLRGRPQPVSWNLTVCEESGSSGLFLPSDSRDAREHRGRHRLASYIAAGGMRDLRPGRHADADCSHRRWVVGFSIFLLAFWVFFLLLPCR
jgi:hypothetical protein